MNDLKQLMNIFALAYQLIAKASKQLPSKEGFLQILEMLGEEGIKECAKVADLGPEAVALAIVQIIQQKSAQKAANGAKLRYIMQLLGKCQPGYLKKGGRCKPCEMAEGVFRNKADMFYEGGDFTNNKNKYLYSRAKTKDAYLYNAQGQSPQNPTLLPSKLYLPDPVDSKMYEYTRRQLLDNNEKLLNNARKTLEDKMLDNRLTLDQNLDKRLNMLPSKYSTSSPPSRTGYMVPLNKREQGGKVSGTEGHPYKSPKATITNKTSKKKQQGGVAYKAYPHDNLDSDELKWVSLGYYPVRTYNGQIASFMTDADAKSEYNLPSYNPEKYSRIIPWDDEDEVMSYAFDRAHQFNKNPKFKDRLNVVRQYLKDPKKFTEGIYIR